MDPMDRLLGLVALGIPSPPSFPFGRYPPGLGRRGLRRDPGHRTGLYSLVRGVQQIGNSRTAAYSNLTPIIALIVAWVWLGEMPRPLQIAGAAVVLVGLSLARLGRERATKRTPLNGGRVELPPAPQSGIPGPSSPRCRTSGNS